MCRRLSTHLVLLVVLFAFPALGTAARDRSVDGAKPTPPIETLPGRGDDAVEIALRYLGTPYSWAGASPSGFDCSGFVMYVYGKLGIALPHSSSMLWGEGRAVTRRGLEPGDVLFFNGLSHVGIYIGGGRFVHSPQSGHVVKVSRLSEGSYGSTYDGARRYADSTSRAARRREQASGSGRARSEARSRARL
jgi:cell wall-associated NlpC family hydrolase